MLSIFRSARSKTIAKFIVPKKVPRISKRKFARVAYSTFALLRGFFFGAISVFFVMSLFSSKAYSQVTGNQCGGTSQPRCEVNVPLDDATATAASNAQTNINNYNGWLKGSVNWDSTGSFRWSFIPNIPTAACVNPQLQSPIGAVSVEMDICSPFNKFQVFMNGVLGFFCLIGCVRQVQSALEA